MTPHPPLVAPGAGQRVDAATADDTRAAGEALAARLAPGDVVVLTGPLGAGKTTFVQGLARGLGVEGEVTSPTFVLAREHRGGRVPLVHVDAYRLGSAWEFDDLDLDSDLADAVVVVEWGEGVAERLSPRRFAVVLARADEGEAREITVHEVTGGDGGTRR